MTSTFRRLLPTIISILTCASLMLAADPDDEEDPYFILVGEAEKAISEKDYEEAAARLLDAMAVEPDNPGNIMLMSNLGMVYSYLDRDSLALATLDEVHRRAPNMTVALLNRAKVQLKLNNDREAFDDFTHVIELDSVNTSARYYHGMIALYSGKRDMAEADFQVLKDKHPDGIQTVVALSALYSLTGRDREAIPYFKKLIESEPSPEYFASLAGCYLAIEELSEASATIAEGLKRYSHDPELYYYRAWLNRDRFRLDDAHADAKRAIELGASPDKVNALFAR